MKTTGSEADSSNTYELHGDPYKTLQSFDYLGRQIYFNF